MNSTARPYDQQAFSPLDHTASWLSHLALAIYMFVVVNFDALAQASDIRIEKRQVVSSAECRIWTQGLRHLFASRLNACWQTDWAIEDPAKTWTRQPVPMTSKHSAHSTSLPVGFRTWLWRYTCLLLFISMLWHRQAIFELRGDKLHSPSECRIRTQGLRNLFASRLNACWQTDWAIEDPAKTWTRQPVPLISKHSAYSTSLPVGFRTWLWWSTCLLFLISMLWYRQAIFESKGDKLSSSTECRIRTQGLRHLFASRLNACWQTDWAIENQAKKLELDSTSLWSTSIRPTRTHCQLDFAPGSSDIHVCCCLFWCSGAGKRYSNCNETSCLPLQNAEFEPKVSDTNSPADWMPADKPTELSRIKLKNLNSTARPYDQQAFSPLDLTASWLSHLVLAIYMFVVVNFDALAQASDIPI